MVKQNARGTKEFKLESQKTPMETQQEAYEAERRKLARWRAAVGRRKWSLFG